ncbi:MAG: two-component system sensor histidine kinase CreC [Steroidobacteraceae bacterium]
MSLTLRLFLIGSVLVAASGWFALHVVQKEIKPAMRQSTEETLVDTANLLAELVGRDLQAGTLSQGDLAQVMAAYGKRRPDADISGIHKDGVSHRVYVTDARGIVLLDSTGRDVGKDYSRWNDVYLTLRGRYGARTTEDVPGDDRTAVMYVAAPVHDAGRIIGVVTVSKPSSSVQPYIEKAQHKLLFIASLFVAGGLAIGGVMSWWLSRSIRRLTRYADAVTAGERPVLPSLPGGELNQLSAALDTMRARLEGKAYVERYVQTLTHELKSPLAAIHGAAELLRQDMSPAQRDRFLTNIDVETARLQSLSERLLHLAQVEQRRDLDERVPVQMHDLIEELLAGLAPRMVVARVSASNAVPPQMQVTGERFLLRQALTNLLDNAIDFTPPGRRMLVEAGPGPVLAGAPAIVIAVFNEGEPIPDYALPRVTERFYSLPRPGSERKSTGLGLNFVQEVAQLHGGLFRIANVAGGVRAELILPTG